jgi:hypothetical protein
VQHKMRNTNAHGVSKRAHHWHWAREAAACVWEGLTKERGGAGKKEFNAMPGQASSSLNSVDHGAGLGGAPHAAADPRCLCRAMHAGI